MDPILTKNGRTIGLRDPILGDHSIGVTKALHSELCNRGYAYLYNPDDGYPGEQIVA
jgi:hypothetical protein